MTGIINLLSVKFALQTSNGSALAETIFSDMNNLNVVTMTSNEYASCFGFTEAEVFAAMDEFNLANKDEVKSWYDSFTIGNLQDIYNPWSIICFLDKKKLKPYWANTSSNGLVSRLIREGNRDVKMQFELLLSGKTIRSWIHEEMVFNQLSGSEKTVWSLLLTAGYLKIIGIQGREYELSLTNYEVRQTFEDMFSSFDGGKKPSAKTAPERFYHGFVLGLLVDLADRYQVMSNRESGYGRYDVMLVPKQSNDNGIILEFKIFNPQQERSLEETVQSALNQIEEKKYEQTLLARGIEKEYIRKYGFAFRGKEVLIGSF